MNFTALLKGTDSQFELIGCATVEQCINVVMCPFKATMFNFEESNTKIVVVNCVITQTITLRERERAGKLKKIKINKKQTNKQLTLAVNGITIRPPRVCLAPLDL